MMTDHRRWLKAVSLEGTIFIVRFRLAYLYMWTLTCWMFWHWVRFSSPDPSGISLNLIRTSWGSLENLVYISEKLKKIKFKVHYLFIFLWERQEIKHWIDYLPWTRNLESVGWVSNFKTISLFLSRHVFATTSNQNILNFPNPE